MSKSIVEGPVCGLLSYIFRALSDEPPQFHVRVCHLYENVYGGRGAQRTGEDVDVILKAVERLNQRWPGMFVPIWPPVPRPDDRLQTIWIFDSFAFWDALQSPGTLQTLLNVALDGKA